MNLKNEDTIVA